MKTGTVSAATLSSAPPVAWDLRIRLSVLMFLEFAIWGGWFVSLGIYLRHLEFTNAQIGSIAATMALGTIVTPMFIGQIADRYFSSERLMAVLHVIGAGLLFWIAQVQDPKQFHMLYGLFLAYALVYAPTLALTNSIAFSHLPDGVRDFPSIRVLGTIGWIAITLTIGPVFAVKSNQPLLLTAGLSLVLAGVCLFLPHTPPKGKPGEALPFVRAVGLLKEPSFAVFFGVSFVIAIVMAFYYNFTGIYLEKGVGLNADNVAPIMTIGQWAELIMLPFLPFFLYRLGMKWVLAIGMLAWGLRYGIFALGEPWQLVVASLALHGICFDFFIAAGFIHVDNKAPVDIRASGQAFFTFLVYGLGMWVGGELSGRIVQAFTDPETQASDWRTIWIIPCVGVMICLAIFILFFRDSMKAKTVPVAETPEPAKV